MGGGNSKNGSAPKEAEPAAVPVPSSRKTTIANNMSELIGETPMVYLRKLNGTKATIALKLESENPMRSVKDRLGLGIIREAEKDGLIKPGVSTLIEATSGNTGIALAQLGAILGYKVILTMPETMSQERRCLLKILGAEVIITPAAKGIKFALEKAQQIAKDTPNAYLTSQFETKYNAKIHYETTGPEIWAQTQGKIDIFVAGVGTGGTITGAGKLLKEKNPNLEVYAVEPQESPVLNGGKPGPHKIQGIGAGMVPAVLDTTLYKEAIKVSSDEALATARQLPATEGIFCGISGGAAVHAALQVASRPENEGKLIVAIIPSYGERYLSTALFAAVKDEVAAWPVVSE